jgi:hypothetical protein
MDFLYVYPRAGGGGRDRFYFCRGSSGDDHIMRKGDKMMKMKKMVFMVLAMVLIAGFAQAKDYEVQKKAGEYTVTVKMDKNPPVVGDNNVAITVKDAANADVKDAKVVVEYSMPAMPGMPAMNYKADAPLKGSEYQAKINFSMTSAWNIVVKITRGGKTVSAKLNVDVR